MDSSNETAKDASRFQTAGALLLAAKDWASVPENFPYGLGALILSYLLYQSELVPRWLSGWGLVGGALMLVMGLLRMFGRPVVYLAIPIILNELVLAVWFMVIGLSSSSTALVIAGVLFITALASTTLSGAFSGSTEDPDYLTAVSANEGKVLLGVLFELMLAASVVAIPIVMFPILREESESLALGYVGARIFEGFFDVVIAFSQLLLLTLSREFVGAGSPTAETVMTEIG